MNCTPILQLLLHVVRYFKLKEQLRNESDDELEIIIMSSVSFKLLLEFLNILFLVFKYLQLRAQKKNKRRLVKPHILMRLLHGYRWE